MTESLPNIANLFGIIGLHFLNHFIQFSFIATRYAPLENIQPLNESSVEQIIHKFRLTIRKDQANLAS